MLEAYEPTGIASMLSEVVLIDREDQGKIAEPCQVKLGASTICCLHLVYPPISTSKPFVTVFIQEYRRPGRQAPDNTDDGAAHGLKGFSHPPRFFDTPLLRSITNITLIDPLPVRRSSIAKVGIRYRYTPSQDWEPRTF
jgi:hypothetical protein